MRALLRRVREAQRDQRGLTLVELIVAMSLGVLVLVIAGAFLGSVQKASVGASASSSNTRTASVGMREMERMFRVATNNPTQLGDDTQYAFQYATATTVRFFAYINLASNANIMPLEVQFTYDSSKGTITETKWNGTAVDTSKNYWSFPMSTGATIATAPTSSITLASSVVPTTLFTYYDNGNNVLTPGVGGLSAADLQSVASVQINLTVGTTNSASIAAPQNVTMSNLVGMPNLQIGS